MQIFTDFSFEEALERAKELISMEEVEDDMYEGYLQLKDLEGFADWMMNRWVAEHDLGRSVNREKLHLRYITPQEFYHIIEKPFAQEYERNIERAKKEREDRVKRRTDRVEGTPKDWEEKFDKAITGFAVNAFSSNREEKEARNNFDLLYPYYALFGIYNENDRIRFARLLQEPDRYFYAMKAVNPTLADFFLAKRRFRIPTKERSKHTYIVAKSGYGKSELKKTLVRLDILKGDSAVIVLDPNGDFAKEIAQFKENASPEKAEQIVYIDPTLSPFKLPVINPFDVVADNDLEFGKSVSRMFDLLKSTFEELNTKLTSPMELLLQMCIPVIFEKEDGTLMDLYRFMFDDQNSDLVEMGKNSRNLASRRGFESGDFHHMRYNISKDGLKSRLMRILVNDVMTNLVCGKTSIDIDKAIQEKKVIIFNLSKGGLGGDLSKVYGRFVLDYILGLAFSRATQEKKERTECRVYIDEFHNYTTASMKTAFEECRKYKFNLTVATQTVGQEMSTEFCNSVLGNTHVKIIGGAGHSSRSAMSREMGINNKDIADTAGISPDVLRELAVGEYVVQIGNKKPFKMTNRTKTLDSRNAMSPEDWNRIANQQLKKYYVDITTIREQNSMLGKLVTKTPMSGDLPADTLKRIQSIRDTLKEDAGEEETPKKTRRGKRNFKPNMD